MPRHHALPPRFQPDAAPAANDNAVIENAELRQMLSQAEDCLRAIRGGEVDGLFVPGSEGGQLFTLEGTDRAYRQLIEEMGEGALILTPQGVVAYSNRRFAELADRPLTRVIGSRIGDCFAPEGHAALAQLLAAGRSHRQTAELDLLTATGLRLPALLSVRHLAVDGLPDAICMVATDLTEQKRGETAQQARKILLNVIEHQRETENTLQASIATLRLHDNALGAISQGVLISDARGRTTYVNQACEAITGFSAAEMADRSSSMLQGPGTSPETLQRLREALCAAQPFHGELLNYRKDGTPFWNQLSVTPVFGTEGEVTQFVGVMHDVTARKAAEECIRQLAHFDPLTGLPNRALMNDRATQALQIAHRGNEPLALLFIDLDHFKNVNDSLGHRVGDLLLVEIAGRFLGTLRVQDTLSRTGGDEFVLLLPGTGADGAAHVAQKLLESAARPCQVDGHELSITPTIGIALYPVDGSDFDSLAKSADAAMYRAKQGGRNDYCFHTPEIQAQSARVLTLENALRRALERGQMQLHYQPQRALSGDRIVGAEALLRWQHPELGWVSPAEFIPVAESSGLITSIGEWVLRTAVRQLKAWMDGGMAPMIMAVNLSAVQFRQPEFPELVGRILEEAGVEPRYLELELTEGVASDDPLNAIAVMDKLHARGVRMSIDDFGTGYSSLSYLKRFKVYKLKVDQSFVRNVTEDAEDQAIVTAIISMARSMGMQTIAEGVETAAQMEFLRGRGCDEMQGYWFSRPLAADKFAAFVSARPIGSHVPDPASG